MAIHSKSQTNVAEKLAYLKDVLKDGPARHVIEGLAQDAEYYKEAIECLQRYYDQPCLIQQVHIHAIYDPSSLKIGNSKEVCHLHDVAAPHLNSVQGHGLWAIRPIHHLHLGVEIRPNDYVWIAEA